MSRFTIRQFTRDPRAKIALVLAGGSLAIAFLLYSPALRGAFVLDDLPLGLAAARPDPLQNWMWRPRPVLMLSYGLNQLLFGPSPAAYHAVNVVIHALNACLVFLVICRLLERAKWSERQVRVAAAVGALVFLVHPLQTESVSYIAGRSESLAATFLLLAYAVFLHDRQVAISWSRALAVIALFAVAVKTKEIAVSLAGILVLTDLLGPGASAFDGVRRNWRLYVLMLPGVAVAAVMILRMLRTAESAGFSVANYKWYQYAFTEARAIFEYLQLAAVPVGQSLDHDFAPSRTITEHGTFVYIALLALMIVIAILWRRRYPVACFGFLMFLTWLAPTSSVIPLSDAVVERRMYLALLGLILIGCEAVRSWGPSRPAAAVLVITIGVTFGGYCYARNRLWSDPNQLLALSAKDAQHNPRPLLNIAEVMIRSNQCQLAIPYLDRADRIAPGSYFVHSIRGRALACLGRLEEALAQFDVAARIQPSSDIYQWMGLVLGQMRRIPEAGVALRKAVKLGPESAAAHGSLGLWYESVGDFRSAEREYLASLSYDTTDRGVRARLERLRRRSPGAANETVASKYERQLIRRAGDSPEDAKVYVVMDGKKRWVTNAEWIQAHGYDWPHDVHEIPASELDAIPSGPTIEDKK
jgi:Flp pilus assembly protein TadD